MILSMIAVANTSIIQTTRSINIGPAAIKQLPFGINLLTLCPSRIETNILNIMKIKKPKINESMERFGVPAEQVEREEGTKRPIRKQRPQLRRVIIQSKINNQ